MKRILEWLRPLPVSEPDPEIDSIAVQVTKQFNEVISKYLDSCVEHIPPGEYRDKSRLEIEIFFYKYYKVRAVPKQDGDKYVIDFVVERTSIPMPYEQSQPDTSQK